MKWGENSDSEWFVCVYIVYMGEGEGMRIHNVEIPDCSYQWRWWRYRQDHHSENKIPIYSTVQRSIASWYAIMGEGGRAVG